MHTGVDVRHNMINILKRIQFVRSHNFLRKINIELQISENVLLDFRQIHTVFIVTYIGGSFYCKMMNMTTSENRQHRGPKTVFTIRIQNKKGRESPQR